MSDLPSVPEVPDAAGTIARALPGEPAKALAVLEALREAGCLRESLPDWHGLPAGSHIVTDLRIVEGLQPVTGDPLIKLRYASDLTFSAAFSILGTATAEMTRMWAERRNGADE